MNEFENAEIWVFPWITKILVCSSNKPIIWLQKTPQFLKKKIPFCGLRDICEWRNNETFGWTIALSMHTWMCEERCRMSYQRLWNPKQTPLVYLIYDCTAVQWSVWRLGLFSRPNHSHRRGCCVKRVRCEGWYTKTLQDFCIFHIWMELRWQRGGLRIITSWEALLEHKTTKKKKKHILEGQVFVLLRI